MQYEPENPLSGVPLGIFPRKSRRSQWRTRWKISPRHFGYGNVLPRQVDLKYVGRLLLDNEEGCTWSQIPAKGVHLYILEVSFCLFHQYVKYCFAQIQPSVTLKICLIENFCIHIWIQYKKLSRPLPGRLQAYPWASMTGWFFPHTVPCEAIVWSLADLEKCERQGRCPELSLWVLIFMFSTRLLGFFLSTSGFSGWHGPGAGGSFYIYSTPRRLRRRPGYVER